MQNVFVVRDLRVQVGQPGAIHWTFVPPDWQAQPLAPGELETSDEMTSDTPFLPRVERWRKAPAYYGHHLAWPAYFDSLLTAYAATGNRAFLGPWAAYLDDWAMNQKADADRSPYNTQLYKPQEVESLAAFAAGLHPIEVVYADFRGGKDDMYCPNQEYGCVWPGDRPALRISGPGLEKQEAPACLLWRQP